MTPSTYTRTYSSLGKPAEDESKSKSYTRTYSTLGRDKTSEDEKDKPKSYTRSYTTLGRTRASDEKEPEKKEPSPPKRTTSRFGSTKDLTAETRSRLSSSYTPAKKEEKGPPITFNTRYKVAPTTRNRSRDPSPTTDSSTSSQPQTALQRLTAKRELSRERSPAGKTTSVTSRLSATRSRDPSPVSTSYTDSALDKYSSSRSYSSSALRPKPKASETLKDSPAKSNSGTVLSYTDRLSSTREKSYDQNSSLSKRPSITSLTSSLSRSRDPSPVDSKYHSLSSYRISNGAEKSREPSPSITLSRPKLRETSPISVSSYRRPSREPSPSESHSKYGSTSSGFLSSTSKTFGKTTTPAYSTPKAPDVSVSYMSTSEANTRPSRISFINRRSPQKDKVPSPSQIPLRNESPKVPVPEPVKAQKESESESSEDETTSSEEEETDESLEKEIKPPQTTIMIQVTTITRGTSPTPPSSSSSRIRRNEIAKMIEKVRQRPLQGPSTSDQSTQSDRMDDSTRYSRFGSLATTSYSPSPSYSSRYKSDLSTSRYTRDSSENTSVASSEKSESSDKTSTKSDKTNFALPSIEAPSNKSSSNKSASTTTSDSSSLASRISISKERAKLSSSKSKTSESEKSLPPQSPTKSESPKVAPTKVSNKDFRKSALNMGPTDRVRKSKSSSSENSSPTVEKTRLQFQQLLNGGTINQVPVERSSSVESESSTESLEGESQIEQKQPEPTKEEIISHKIEEAKSFLLKTLGNPAAHSAMKSPSPMSELHDESSCQTLNSEALHSQQTTKSLGLDFSNLQKTVSGEKAWWMNDSNESRGSTQNASPENGSSTKTNSNAKALTEDESKLTNGFSEMTLKTTQDSQNSKWSWLNGNPLNLNESFQKLERVGSGEKAWWCKSPENKTTSDNQAFAQNADNTRNNNAWEQETQADISEIQRDDEFPGSNYRLSPLPRKVAPSSTPLGDRVEPEGLESNLIDRKSDYDIANGGNYQKDKLQDFNARPRLFISRHTNIDDLLGKSL